MRLAICVPSMEMVHADFMISLAGLVQELFNNPPEGLEAVQVRNDRGSLVHMIREYLIRDTLETSATHILFLDSDMVFPKDTFHRLLSHDKDMVGGNYVQRTVPAIPNTVTTEGKPMYTREESTGLEEFFSSGLGCVLIKREVFEKTERPWFDTYWKPDGIIVGEDIFFFLKARKAGFIPYIDHDLSKEIKHIGMFEYTNSMAMIE